MGKGLTWRIVSVLLLLACMLPPSVWGATMFDFESVPGLTTPFNDTADGISASFSSPDGAVFSTSGPVIFVSLSGQVLADSDPASHLLNITLDRRVDTISMNFALNGPSGTFSLTAFLGGTGGTVVGSTSSVGAIPPGHGIPEGFISFGGAVFDTVSLTSSVQNFAIDNVAVTASAVVGPDSDLLLGSGLVVLVGRAAWRKSRKR